MNAGASATHDSASYTSASHTTCFTQVYTGILLQWRYTKRGTAAFVIVIDQLKNLCGNRLINDDYKYSNKRPKHHLAISVKRGDNGHWGQ